MHLHTKIHQANVEEPLTNKKSSFVKNKQMTYLRIVLQLFLAVTFLFSAYTKAIAPGFFEVLLEQQGMVPNRMYGAWATRLIIALETWLGICLMVSFYVRFVLRFSFALLIVFSIQLIYLMINRERGNCGCFGEMIRMSPLEPLGKNVILPGVNGFLLYDEGQNIKKTMVYLGTVSFVICYYHFCVTDTNGIQRSGEKISNIWSS